MTYHECKSALEELWEPRRSVPFNERTPRDGEISNLLCMFQDGFEIDESELAPIRGRIIKLLNETS